MKDELFFIYGSFRDPEHARGYMFQEFSGAKPIIPYVQTKELKWDLKNVTYGDFPALVPGTFAVLGSVFEVPKDVIAWMDAIENVESGLYRRIKVKLDNDLMAWAYEFLDFDIDLDDKNIDIEHDTKSWRL